MKLKNIISQRYASQVVGQFGNAKLIRQLGPRGVLELPRTGAPGGRGQMVCDCA
jgi:hypothetical protein